MSQLLKYSHGTSPKRLHPYVRNVLYEALEVRRFPAPYDWLGRQPHTRARELVACLQAIDAREAWQIRNPSLVGG